MYEKDGEKYFVLDTHTHFWDASPENWVKGAEHYAKGWIECFHAYQSLGPENTHWSLEHFQKYSADDYEKDVFVDGYVDVAITQPTYLRDWYAEGFNDLERNAQLLDRFPGRFIVNGRFDPRDGDEGLRQLEADHERFGLKGVKLYTAEWHRDGSRGWALTDPAAEPFFAKCEELGIKNIHVHKGPTIWPLDKDSFDVKDVDIAATSHPDLNFIVEHVGLPRIEDFCFMATQEPNVYAGLSVVIGGLMHARPRFFAKCMGELLFWVGEDKMMFGSDYAIWEPKWQVEGLVDWDYPDDTYSDYPRWTTAAKQKVLGLNAARLYGVDVPEECRLREGEGTPAAEDDAQLVESPGVITRARVLDALSTVHDPELDEPITTLGFVGSCEVSDGGDVSVRLRLPTPQCAPNFAFLMASDAREAVRRVSGVGEVGVVLEDHYTAAEINAAVGGGGGFDAAFPGESTGDLEALRELFWRKALLARQGRVAAMLLAGGGCSHEALVGLTVADLPDHREVDRCLQLRRELGLPCRPSSPALIAGDGSPIPVEELAMWLRRARLVGLSLESNGGLCRSLLRVRHGVHDPTEEVAT